MLVLHALTMDSHATGPAEPGHLHPGWWDGVIGPGAPLDTDRWFVVCPNVLGGCQGTTGPASDAPDGKPYGSRFPRITIRDQVAVEAALADELGIDRWHAVVGGSMGGMRVLEWAVGYPQRVARAIVVSVGAFATAEQIGLCNVQIRAVKSDPNWRGGDYYDAAPGDGPHVGLGIARGIGQISYRSEIELDERFGREPQDGEDPFAGGRYAVESYLEHHGELLVRRFDANTYVVLSEAMNHHDVGRDRGGIAAALATVEAARPSPACRRTACIRCGSRFSSPTSFPPRRAWKWSRPSAATTASSWRRMPSARSSAARWSSRSTLGRSFGIQCPLAGIQGHQECGVRPVRRASRRARPAPPLGVGLPGDPLVAPPSLARVELGADAQTVGADLRQRARPCIGHSPRARRADPSL